jgi:hypothetical protein
MLFSSPFKTNIQHGTYHSAQQKAKWHDMIHQFGEVPFPSLMRPTGCDSDSSPQSST